MDELEDVLRQFQPRRPGPLPDNPRAPRRQWPLWLAAAGLAAVVVIVARYERAPAVPASDVASVSLGTLTSHGLESAEALDRVLMRTSRAILPDVERPGGALQALAKE